MSAHSLSLRHLAGCTLGAVLATAPAVFAADAADTSAEPQAIGEVHSRPLTLDAVLVSVQQHHPMIAIAEAGLSAKRAEARSAQAIWAPDASASFQLVATGSYPRLIAETYATQRLPARGVTAAAGYRVGQGTFPTYDGDQTANGGEVWASIAAPLLRNGSIDPARARVRATALGAEEAQWRQADTLMNLSGEAAAAYWAWVAAGEYLAIEESLLDLAIQRERQLSAKVDAGDIPPFELRDNQRAMLKREAQVIAAEQALASAAFKLSYYLRSPDGRPLAPPRDALPAEWAPPRPLSQAELTSALAHALAQRPDVKALDATIRQTNVALELAQNKQLPTLDLKLAISQGMGTQPESLLPAEAKIGASFAMPTLTREARADAAKAHAEASRLQSSRQWLHERIEVAVNDAALRLSAAERQTQIAADELALATWLEAGERDRLQLGEGTVLMVNLREQATADAARRLTKARASQGQAWSDLMTLTAQWQQLDSSNNSPGDPR